MNGLEKLIEEIENHGTLSGGKTALLKYLRGEKISRPAAVKAKCCDCMGYYADGRVDCENPTCPLYPYMPYRGKNIKAEENQVEIEEIEVEELVEV